MVKASAMGLIPLNNPVWYGLQTQMACKLRWLWQFLYLDLLTSLHLSSRQCPIKLRKHA